MAEIDAILLKMKNAKDLTGELKGLLKKLSADAAAQIVNRLKLDITFDPATTRLTSLIDERVSFTLGEMQKANYDGLREILLEGLAEGQSTGQMAETIDAYTGAKFNTSPETIARTEIAGAQNMTAVEVYRQAGFNYKVWLSSRDGKVRPSHVAADGQKKALIEPFFVGQSFLQFPGDKSPYPEDWMNCRCTVLAE